MSTQDSRTPLRYVRSSRRRKMPLDVDLNVPPPSDTRDQVATSALAGTQDEHRSHEEQVEQPGGSIPPEPIDVDAFDDDVVISSPRAFAEAKNNSRRTHGRTQVVDVESGERSSRFTLNYPNKRRRASQNQTIINYDLYVNLVGSGDSMREDVQSFAQPPPPLLPPPPPKEPTFSCPVCMGPLVEEMSTKCGHIFCKTCIKAAITAQSKCPTCRRKVTAKDIIRVYLPTTN